MALVGNRAERRKPKPRRHHMRNRRDEIDGEIRHLSWLVSQLTDQRTIDGIKVLITDLEAEKAALHAETK